MTQQNKINNVEMRDPKNNAEKLLFGYIMDKVEGTEYGKIDLCLTVKNGVVTNIKNKTEESYSIHNAAK